MKNHRFPWLRNRTTDNRKCEKARNIKEKRTIEMFNTASRPLVARLSSPSAKQLRFENGLFDPIAQKPRKTIGFPGLFLTLMSFRLHCRGYRRAQNAERNIIILRKALLTNKKDAL